MEQVFATADKLSEVIRNMQQCLQCTICLHTISEPMRTRCGHRFCRECIQTVLQSRNALCPLCNTNLPRRGISKDECMEMYVNKLEELIEAVKLDSGIDISLHTARPQSTRESSSSDPMEHHKPDTEEHYGPSCSYVESALKAPRTSRPKSYGRTRKMVSRNSEGKKNSTEGSDITKFLNKYALSGIAVLPSNESNGSEKNSMDVKVQNWLESLPNDEPLDDFNKTQPMHNECNLDDTTMSSVSQIDEKAKNGNSKSKKAVIKTHRTYSKAENRRVLPGTSRLNDDTKDQERTMDEPALLHRGQHVDRTSPCNMLPSVKQNWSSVARFGKELRKKKRTRKLRSLDVSIENKSNRYSRSLDEIEKEAIKSGPIRDKETDKEGNPSESMEKRLPNEQTPTKEKHDASMQEIQAEGTSFIALKEGEHVHITKLNNSQMKDIIGVAGPSEDRRYKSRTMPPKTSMEKAFVRSNNASPDLLCGDSFLGTEVIEQTPTCSRLSLKRRSTDPKSEESRKSNDVARLETVKRDLYREIDDDESARTRLTSETKDKSEGSNRPDAGSVYSTSSNENRNKKEDKGQNKCFVTFKKLGKVYKRRKKRVAFLHLGSILPKSVHQEYLELRLQNPCNSSAFQDLSTQKLASECRFGNNTRISVNVTPQDEMESILPTEEEASAFVQPGPSNIASKPPGVLANLSESQYRASNDVFFITLPDNEEKQPEVVEKIAPKTAIRMLSPKKDSQLKFLSLDSPITDDPQVSKMAASSAKRNNFSDIKGVHSRALILRSQQVRESSQPDSSSASDKKRKRADGGDKLEGTKRKSMDAEDLQDGGSCHSGDSFFSKATYVKRPAITDTGTTTPKNVTVAKEFHSNSTIPSTKPLETVLLSSDTDTDSRESQEKDGKKAFKRISTLRGSGTDSLELVCLGNEVNSDQVAAPQMTKRKRPLSPDSDCDMELNAIASNWYKDLNATDRHAKKGKVEQTRASSAFMHASSETKKDSLTTKIPNRVYTPMYRQPSTIDVGSSSDGRSFRVKRQETSSQNRGTFDSDSPDFGSTVDRIRDIQKRATESSDNNKDSDQRREAMLHDNFDEIMANVDTEAILNEYSKSKPRSLNKDDPELHKSCSSDKENKYKESEPLYESFSDEEKTLTPGSANVVDRKRNPMHGDELQGRVSKESRKNIWDKSASDPLADNDKAVGNANMEATSYEHDSLMDVTQHYLQIKQFEEDLFGKSTNPKMQPDKKKETREQRTPSKNAITGLSGAKRTDAEHSAEEDDIVENTPDDKMKTAQPTSATTKSSSSISPISRVGMKQFARTPSTVVGTNSRRSTPLCKRRIHPLCESTPIAQTSRKNNFEAGTKRTEDKGFKSATSTNDKRTTNVSGNIVQSFARQRLCFVCSGLGQAQIEHVKRLASIVNARYVTQFDPDVTHVIVKADKENNGASKTLKYLQGIAYRKWIVVDQWVTDCLKEKKLINMEPYEAVDNRTLEAGPRKSRLRQNNNLFEDFVFLFIGPYVDVTVEQYQELLRAIGATVVETVEALAVEKKRLKVIVVQANYYNYEIIGWYKKARAVPVAHDWVVECISQYKLISLYPYLQELARQEVLALNFPEFLVEQQDSDEDSDDPTNSDHVI
ncbi:breast cancer type 1 susceptibility protein homolog isoform X2 [Colletes gigas]|uniref:breast cancer type 1 susceptibility protein homolog isoform X2 n=1 Tax=Colletes gigas TaxID=935657 RepID=UPI001C9A8653|nr:breast cancer type 1 susceptibility protein homolog isoform X2 [Colletes gigas]